MNRIPFRLAVLRLLPYGGRMLVPGFALQLAGGLIGAARDVIEDLAGGLETPIGTPGLRAGPSCRAGSGRSSRSRGR